MKITVLMGSPRKKDSFNVCKQIEQQLNVQDNTIQFESIFLKDYHIEDCKGCNLCFQKSEKDCPCHDDLNDLKERIFSADGLIIASPVYAYQVTGQLKRLIDRMSYLFHRQEMVGTPAVIVVTTDGGGSKQVYKYLKMTLSGWGLDVIGDIQIISPMYFKDRQPKSAFGYDEHYHAQNSKRILSLSKLFYRSLSAIKKRTPTFYDIFMFNCLRSKTYTSAADRTYWEQKGWINASYFYPTNMNAVKRIFGYGLKILIHRVSEKYLEK